MDPYLPLFAMRTMLQTPQVTAEAGAAGSPPCPVVPFSHTRAVYEGRTSQPPLQ